MLQIIFSGNITYSDPATEKAILDFLEGIEALPNIGDPFYTTSWLRQWSRYMAKNGKYIGLHNTDEVTYIRNLEEVSAIVILELNQDLVKRIPGASHSPWLKLSILYKLFHNKMFGPQYFLAGSGNAHALDVIINEDKTRITASRFFVQSVDVFDAVNDRKLLVDLRTMADKSPFNVTVFSPFFLFFDQVLASC